MHLVGFIALGRSAMWGVGVGGIKFVFEISG